ncbi:hypothetical protein IWQ60_010634 [Tieghemiomyces parasiticus]|uniref:Fe2OG dioxygenase domain-containing protein n=1 Tax=Tieghemiomyces parasiticus TaxID=78921 RepID=A0A9W7ZPZ6_9FUNG|nr:hypothetical protein IWQ60_010634 [Tieghemiomyces parasiticus]
MPSRPEANAATLDANLAVLASIFEAVPLETLRATLVGPAGHSVERAVDILTTPAPDSTAGTLRRKRSTQTRLTTLFGLGSPGKAQRPRLETPVEPSNPILPPTLSTSASPTGGTSTTGTAAPPPLAELIKWNAEAVRQTTTPPRVKSRLVYLQRPEDVERALPCILIPNFLPVALAKELLHDLLDLAPRWPIREWYMFDRLVTSSNRSILFADDDFPEHLFSEATCDAPAAEGEARPKESPQDTPATPTDKSEKPIGVDEANKQYKEPSGGSSMGYYYNGRPMDIHPYIDVMRRARVLVEAKVHEVLAARKRSPLESSEPWRANATVANSYDGSVEGVGWHNDRLTNIGPFPTIASLSLGVTREFRIRRIPGILTQTSNTTGSFTSAATTPISHTPITHAIPLPHNCLLIMLPPMQEEYQHTVPRHTPIDRHPISGSIRINLTFRHYRSEYGPSSNPCCHCGIPCQLRPVTKQATTLGRYFYMCEADALHGQGKCGFFQWLDPVIAKAIEEPGSR